MPKTFLLLTTLLLVILLQEGSSTHLKTKARKTQIDQKGLCWAKFSQNKNWRIRSADDQWIYTRHGQCKDLSYIGDRLNDDTDYLTLDGDCNTCSVQVFDDANLGGGSKTFQRKDCNKFGGDTCELGDWDDRISSAKLCCDKDPKLDYRYGQGSEEEDAPFPFCQVKFREDTWKVPQYLELIPRDYRCDETSYVGDTFNDNIDQISFGDQCLDCTIQLFDDADFKGDSKTIKIGSNECPIGPSGFVGCGMGGWDDRVSSIKVCCPTSIV